MGDCAVALPLGRCRAPPPSQMTSAHHTLTCVAAGEDKVQGRFLVRLPESL